VSVKLNRSSENNRGTEADAFVEFATRDRVAREYVEAAASQRNHSTQIVCKVVYLELSTRRILFLERPVSLNGSG
jgi:hypothetical protein